MTIKEKVKQLREDIKYIELNYGSIDNKSFWVESGYEELIKNPCSRTAYNLLMQELIEIYDNGYVISYGQGGLVRKGVLSLDQDNTLQEIAKRWYLIEEGEIK